MKLHNYVITLVVLVVAIATTWTVKGNLFPTIQQVERVDTTYVEIPYEVKVREEIIVPREVVIYKTLTDTLTKVEIVQDTVYFTTITQNNYQYASSFLTNYPKAPKFLQMKVDSEYISFTGLSPNGQTQTSRWSHQDLWTLTLSDSDWVSFSGKNSLKRGTYQRIGVGYQYSLEESPYLNYGFGYNFGRFSGEVVVSGSVNPYISAGVNYTW